MKALLWLEFKIIKSNLTALNHALATNEVAISVPLTCTRQSKKFEAISGNRRTAVIVRQYPSLVAADVWGLVPETASISHISQKCPGSLRGPISWHHFFAGPVCCGDVEVS